jgi:elongation factor G
MVITGKCSLKTPLNLTNFIIYLREKISEAEIPDNLKETVQIKRQELLETLANVDDEMAEHLLNETFPNSEEIKAAIRRCTIKRSFLPVMMGSAYKNVGVQLLLDGVDEYLPNPTEVDNTAIEVSTGAKKILPSRSNEPFVGLAFKLEEGRFGQLTYIRVYQGKLSRGSWIHNIVSNKKVKVPRLVRMHSDEMEDVEEVGAGEICAMFGVECSSGDTFTDGSINVSMTPMHVPDPVISLSIKPESKDQTGNFSKALARFQKEDPTFRVHIDAESGETIISGMGELHLEIYVERMKREYNCPCATGKPQVAFRETIQNRAEFNFTHKKQSGGAGQFARVAGFIEPIRSFEEDAAETESNSTLFTNEFVSKVVGGAVPTEFIPACEKGFLESAAKGYLVGHPFVGVRYVLEDGTSHVVDSNEHSFRTASGAGFRKACEQARPVILEPIMKVSVMCPIEFQGSVMGNLNKRRALILDSEAQEDTLVMTSEVPLNAMFGYSTDLRSLTQGKGEFTMEYKTHRPVMPNIQAELVDKYKKNNANEKK